MLRGDVSRSLAMPLSVASGLCQSVCVLGLECVFASPPPFPLDPSSKAYAALSVLALSLASVASLMLPWRLCLALSPHVASRPFRFASCASLAVSLAMLQSVFAPAGGAGLEVCGFAAVLSFLLSEPKLSRAHILIGLAALCLVSLGSPFILGLLQAFP